MRGETAALVETMVTFGGWLRRNDVEVGPARVEVAIRALGCVDARNPEEAYWALRCAFVSRHEDADTFDRVFQTFWLGRAERELIHEAVPPRRRVGSPEHLGDAEMESGREVSGISEAEDEGGQESQSEGAHASYSPLERLRRMEFRDWGPEELAAARPLIQRIGRSLPVRRGRRTRASRRGASIDRRATLRRAMRTEGHPFDLLRRERNERPRRMVFLVDISGSMEPYARPLIVFCHAVRQASAGVEAFAFGTRLTRLTRDLVERDPERALDRAARSVPDWAGGTRIGANLVALNAEWGRRNLTRGAVVVVFSDGWERGDLDLIAREMERLHRAAHAVVWVNPLAGEPDYEPLAAGMAAALPHVDRFLPAHNLRSLERLAAALEEVGEVARPGQRARAVEPRLPGPVV